LGEGGDLVGLDCSLSRAQFGSPRLVFSSSLRIDVIKFDWHIPRYNLLRTIDYILLV